MAEYYKYECGLCTKLLLDPHQTWCGHRLCGTCLRKHLEEQGDPAPCPYGEPDCETLTLKPPHPTVRQDYPLQRELKRKLVACTYKEFGCSQFVKGDMLQKHENECGFGKMECEYSSLGCQQAIRRDEQEHHSMECKYTPQCCRHCSLPNIAEIHMSMADHQKECPLRPRECPHTIFGCRFKGTEEEVKTHTNTDSHLEMMSAYMQAQTVARTNMQIHYEEMERTHADQMTTMEERLTRIEQAWSHSNEQIRNTEKVVANQGQYILTLEIKVRELSTTRREAFSGELKQLTSDMASLTQSNLMLKPEVAALREKASTASTKFDQLDLRFQVLETASYDGNLLWKIRNYTGRKSDAQTGRVQSLYSQAFYTSRHGYRMCARVYLNGDGMGSGTHLSLFFVVMRGEYDALLSWPFRSKVSLMLLDQVGRTRHIIDTFRPDPSSSSFQRPTTDMNVASGCPLFVSHLILEATDSMFLQRDTLFIKIAVDTEGLQKA